MSEIIRLETVTPEDLLKTDNHFLLLEGDLNEELYDEVSKVEFQASKQWIYEDTEFDDEKTHGPLLVELGDDNNLIKYFISHWSQQHMGVVISTKASKIELIQHLLNMRYVDIPGIDPLQKVLFRWYEPRQLFGLLNNLNEKEIAYLMHIITNITWCEWAYDQGIWYQQHKPKLENIKDFSPPLMLTQATIDSMNKHDEQYYVRQLTRELIHEHPNLLKKGDGEMLKQSVLKQTRAAISHGIDRRNDIKEYIYSKIKLD